MQPKATESITTTSAHGSDRRLRSRGGGFSRRKRPPVFSRLGMPGGAAPTLHATTDVNRVEAPVTFKTYLMCVFAACGGLFFGYDSGYISGVNGMSYFIKVIEGPDATVLSTANKSLIVSILSAGTFFGAIIAGDIAEWIGRKWTIITGCLIFLVGVILQVASHGLGLMVAGRLIAGLGVGFVSAVLILYMSEIAPRKVRGTIVSGYQFCVTIGLLLASAIDYATQDRQDSGSYRIPIAIQILWSLILGGGLLFLPDSPRYFVKKGKLDTAAKALARLRDQPIESDFIQDELAEIIANHEYELSVIPETGYFDSWLNCFKGSLWVQKSNLRRTILGTSLQMMQQWTGVNFVFYFGTTFFQDLGTIQNAFLISLITNLVNVVSTPVSFWTIERFGRRFILLWGALGMVICQFIVAIIGTVLPDDPQAITAMIALICIYIFFFASTWGPGAWVVIGEIFPLQIRSRGVGLSTASNWLWNCIIAIITPYMVDADKGNLGAKVFFVWGSLCTCCFIYAYFLIPETKGLTLEQVDAMMEETTPRNSAKWVPHSTFAAEMGLANKAEHEHIEKEMV
ncbi:putative Major facilitator superfamily (MFS) profile domain-containing protein [Seiridium unicorne]|uniref:Major facilitator superfamily (MFS) profile domain-containing protein n=1 Tax=Seiridium unicorne TaxID=138068 RepID=A0ABR2UEZ0_9PEZI